MKEVTITCDRCGKVVNGIVDELPEGTVTGGFYDVTDEYWSRFAVWEEENVCDECMHSDPGYKAIYHSKKLTKTETEMLTWLLGKAEEAKRNGQYDDVEKMYTIKIPAKLIEEVINFMNVSEK
jgi:hypothetical protein